MGNRMNTVSASAPTITAPNPDSDPSVTLLTEAVRVATGIPDALPREGQLMLHNSIRHAMQTIGHVAAVAPTGSGKSFAALVPAVMAAVENADRTIISTDSLALMGQIQDKDAGTVIEAARRLHPNIDIKIAFLKGVSNYLDPAAVIAAGQALTGAKGLVEYGRLAAKLREAPLGDMPWTKFAFLNDGDEREQYAKLVIWALETYESNNENEHGDRHACPIEHTPDMWRTLSATASEADDGKRYGVASKVTQARLRALEANIVVTNHSILAVQAAKGVPVIVGSQKLGEFQHIVVDEAHTLPSHVRSQGAAVISGGRIARLARTVAKATGNTTTGISWRDDGEAIADELDAQLEAYAAAAPQPGRPKNEPPLRRLTKDDNALGDLDTLISDWIDRGKALIGKADKSPDPDKAMNAKSAREALITLKSDLGALGRHMSGWARWVEKATPSDPGKYRAWWESHVSPIDVGFLLRDNLWAPVPHVQNSGDSDGDGFDIAEPDEQEEPITRLSVSAISATMPSNYPSQAGLDAPLLKYPSPFVDAYARSGLYIPQANTGDDYMAVTDDAWGKRKFDVHKHRVWATDKIVELVRANGGSALVLAATGREGKAYAAALRKHLPDSITVHSQWDGPSATRLVSDWRADVSSVLVGTKSMMTGVDAQGATCTLVIVDRIPRSPSNPIDDARMEQIMERQGVDKWSADRQVYSTDAALLLKQAVGRLIRSASDSGLVACLDPRLLKLDARQRGALTYQEQVRQVYMNDGGLYDFGKRFTRVEQAADFLRSQRRA